MITHPDGVYSPEQLAIVRRQIAFREGGDPDGVALADWDRTGVLIAPRGVRVLAADIPDVVTRWRHDFTDLLVELTALISSADGRWLTIEWTWQVTRRQDHARSSTPDAIVVALAHGRIVSWREYFDTFGSVEFTEPTP